MRPAHTSLLLFCLVPALVGLRAPTTSPRCWSVVVEDPYGNLILECWNPCDSFCQSLVVEYGPIEYATCICTGGQEPECCHMGLVYSIDPALPLTIGSCTSASGCGLDLNCTDAKAGVGTIVAVCPTH